MPNLPVPTAPTEADASAALRLLRQAFRTFPFADAERAGDPTLGIEVVDLSRATGTRRERVPRCVDDGLLPLEPVARTGISADRARRCRAPGAAKAFWYARFARSHLA